MEESKMITIDSDFENGSLDRAIKLGENWYQLVLRPDTWYWFHCRIKGCKNREIIFQVRSEGQVSVQDGMSTWAFPWSLRERGYFAWVPRDFRPDANGFFYNRPVVSYDKMNWHKINNVEREPRLVSTFRFRHTFTEDEAYLCYNYPYTYTDLNTYLHTIKRHPYVKLESLGKTRNGNDQPVLTITKNTANKKMVLILAREDSDEITGSYAAQGLINHLLDKQSGAILNKYTFKIVPMVSIEGVLAGASWSAGSGYIAARWHESPAPAEIENVKRGIKTWVKHGYRIVFAGKIHGCWSFMPFRADIITANPRLRDVFVATRDKYWNPRPRDLQIRPKGYFERYLLDEYGVNACFATHANGNTPEDVKKCGRGLCKAMQKYLLTAPNQ